MGQRPQTVSQTLKVFQPNLAHISDFAIFIADLVLVLDTLTFTVD